MLKKSITYKDYNGVERTEDYYFNLTEAELMKMELGTTGTFTSMVTGIINAKDLPSLISIFEELIRHSYGKKSPDGKRIMKSDEIFREFEESPAYSQLFMELALDDDKAAEFINAVVPEKISQEAQKETQPPALMPMA